MYFAILKTADGKFKVLRRRLQIHDKYLPQDVEIFEEVPEYTWNEPSWAVAEICNYRKAMASEPHTLGATVDQADELLKEKP